MQLLAFRDRGKLIVRGNSVEFQGKKENVVITGIKRVSYGKQGRDFINNWVRIEYAQAGSTSTAFFADGSLLGWGGVLGGTKKILAALQDLSR